MTAPGEDRDARLAEALAAPVDATRDGRGADVEAAARLDPDLADELRELWASASLADALAGELAGADEPVGGPTPASSSGPGWTLGELEFREEIGRGGMGVVNRAYQQTPHAAVLENWGGLWVCHGVALLASFSAAMDLQARGVRAHWPYIALFTVGLGAWAACFWEVRRRMGPVTFVERQLAHVWGAGMIGLNLVLVAEWLYGLPPMALTPLLAVANGMLFLVKAGILSGEFDLHGGLVLLTLTPGILVPPLAMPLFALVSAMGFIIPGLKYRRRRARAARSAGGRPHRPG